MNQTQNGNFTLRVDGSLFGAGFVIGLVIGKLILRSDFLAVVFGTGLGLAVGTTPEVQDPPATRR